MLPTPISEKALSHSLLDALIRAGLIAVLVIFCFDIFHPFLDLMLWSLILAITLYPLQGRLRRKLGNRDGRAATLIVLIAIAIVIVPIYLLGISVTASVETAVAMSRAAVSMFRPRPSRSPVGRWWASLCMNSGSRPPPT